MGIEGAWWEADSTPLVFPGESFTRGASPILCSGKCLVVPDTYGACFCGSGVCHLRYARVPHTVVFRNYAVQDPQQESIHVQNGLLWAASRRPGIPWDGGFLLPGNAVAGKEGRRALRGQRQCRPFQAEELKAVGPDAGMPGPLAANPKHAGMSARSLALGARSTSSLLRSGLSHGNGARAWAGPANASKASSSWKTHSDSELPGGPVPLLGQMLVWGALWWPFWAVEKRLQVQGWVVRVGGLERGSALRRRQNQGQNRPGPPSASEASLGG